MTTTKQRNIPAAGISGSAPAVGQIAAGRVGRPVAVRERAAAERRLPRPHFSPPGGPDRGGVSALDIVGARFAALCNRQPAIVVDGAALGHGLPARAIGLRELRSLLLHPASGQETRDAVLAAVLPRAVAPPAQTCGRSDAAGVSGAGEGQLVVLGLLLPGLRNAAGRLLRAYPNVGAEDLLGELVTGVLAALPGFDPAAGRVAGRLLARGVTAARRYGRAQPTTRPLPADGHTRTALALLAAGTTADPGELLPDETCCELGGAHPDLALARAVRAGVIRQADAELIGRSRLEDRLLVDLAVELRIAYPTARRRRARAERRIVAWLQAEAAADARRA